jgi:hypothetical protein
MPYSVADPAGRLIWASPTLPGARHDMGAATEQSSLDALTAADVQVLADNGYTKERARPCASTATPSARPRHRPLPPAIAQPERRQHRARPLTRTRERANAQLKSWKILRRIRSCPTRATGLVNAVQALILAG